MKVEIWSDVMCPFCYIGKRRFEEALEQSGYKGTVQVEWKSFQLNPTLKTEPRKSLNEYLAEVKGWTVDYARNMNAQVTRMAAEVGLHYDMDSAVVANSFDAHRIFHYSKTHDKSGEMGERLFKAYFSEGKNIADKQTLISIAKEVGLKEEELKNVLDTNAFTSEVTNDMREAEQLGIRGVPFFVINRKYGVSGAQPVKVFVDALEKAFKKA